MSKVIAKAGITYREYGYVIMPIQRNDAVDGVKYPYKSELKLPVGSQINHAKSQNDWAKFNTPDDVIRIYALVPVDTIEAPEKDVYNIYVFPTGGDICLEEDAEKLTVVKEGKGELMWHCYFSLHEGNW